MPILNGSIVVIAVILHYDLEVAMTNEALQKECHYQITMKYAKELLQKGILTEEEYQHFKQKMLKKYEPIISQYIDLSVDK